MKNSRKFLSIVGVLIFLGLVLSLTTEREKEQPGLKGVFSAVKNKVIGAGDSTQNPIAQGLKAGENQGLPPPESEPDPARKIEQFSTFIKNEAQTLDNPRVNTQEKQSALQDRANKLDDVEKNLLKSVALNNSRPINERILSVYLLGLNRDGGLSQTLASDIAQAPLPDYGPSQPHSEAELRNTQELALRYMAIDKLVQDIRQNPSDSQIAIAAREDLKNQSQRNPIEQVRKYAFDELNKMNSGK